MEISFSGVPRLVVHDHAAFRALRDPHGCFQGFHAEFPDNLF
jgi:hypothetical protein